MGFATASAATAVTVSILANQHIDIQPARLAAVSHAAQIQLIHSLASIGSATFMNVGGWRARRAPAFFFAGIIAYCLPIYLNRAASAFTISAAAVLLGSGWLTLLSSVRTIDQSPLPAGE